MKDDLLPVAPIPHHPDIFHDYVIPVESCENLAFVNVTTFNHSQNKWNAKFSSEWGEEKSFLLDAPNLSSYLSINIEV